MMSVILINACDAMIFTIEVFVLKNCLLSATDNMISTFRHFNGSVLSVYKHKHRACPNAACILILVSVPSSIRCRASAPRCSTTFLHIQHTGHLHG